MAYTGHPNRTSFHFRPQRNWLNGYISFLFSSNFLNIYHTPNIYISLILLTLFLCRFWSLDASYNLKDPNAPMYYKGFYHLFYQHNPLSPDFNDIMIWGHSVSQDMVNWIQLEPALSPTDPFDINSCWSGSATILPDGKPVILYTGLDHNNRQQVTVLAEPKDVSDPLLRLWVKPKYNPVMVPPSNVPYDCFRDPTTAWQGKDGKWRALVGAKEKDSEKGMAVLYRSDDFVEWTEFPTPLLASEVTGMWECPDFFPVSITGKEGVETSVNNDSVRHVLKSSFGGHDCYVIGKYSSETEEFGGDYEFTNTTKDLRYDHGTFYASKAFFDSVKNRRINWGWVIETDTKEEDFEKGWAGLLSLPREMWLDTSGKRLIQWPIEEINNLRTKHVTFGTRHFETGSIFQISGITAAQADVEVTFDLPVLEDNPDQILDTDQLDDNALFDRNNLGGCVYGPFGLLALASNDLSEQTAIFFKIIRRGNGFSIIMGSDEMKSSLSSKNIRKSAHGTILDIDPRHEKKISLRCLIDHSVIESYGAGGRNVITSRVYPTLAIGEAAKLYVFNDGTKGVTMSSLDAWSMRNAEINLNAI